MQERRTKKTEFAQEPLWEEMSVALLDVVHL